MTMPGGVGTDCHEIVIHVRACPTPAPRAECAALSHWTLDMRGNIFDSSETDFDDSVLAASHQHPVLVDFWADWCPPCRALTPVLERIAAAEDSPVRLAKVEVDDNMHLAGRYQLRGFPTVILFIAGEERGRFSGFLAEPGVRDFLGEHGA